jgi:hypothetical protein
MLTAPASEPAPTSVMDEDVVISVGLQPDMPAAMATAMKIREVAPALFIVFPPVFHCGLSESLMGVRKIFAPGSVGRLTHQASSLPAR